MYCDIPDLGRCCFCLPLRRGVLVFGYLNIAFAISMLGLYCYLVNSALHSTDLMFHGTFADSLAEVCVALYCVEIIFNVLLVFGAHTKQMVYIKVFYYYAITTTVAMVVLEIVELTKKGHYYRVELSGVAFAGLCIQLYLITLTHSLLRKLEKSGDNTFENQLQQIVAGERRVENGIYNNNTVIPVGEDGE